MVTEWDSWLSLMMLKLKFNPILCMNSLDYKIILFWDFSCSLEKRLKEKQLFQSALGSWSNYFGGISKWGEEKIEIGDKILNWQLMVSIVTEALFFHLLFCELSIFPLTHKQKWNVYFDVKVRSAYCCEISKDLKYFI